MDFYSHLGVVMFTWSRGAIPVGFGVAGGGSLCPFSVVLSSVVPAFLQRQGQVGAAAAAAAPRIVVLRC